jgi:hypothetical protein
MTSRTSPFFILFLFLLLLAENGKVSAQCNVTNTVFGDGEQVRFIVAYNWGPVWVDAGIVTFSASNETYQGKSTIHLKATGKSFPSYDLLFKVRDYYDSWIDPADFRSYSFKRYTYEGNYTLLNTLWFDHQNQRVISNTKTQNNPQRNDTLPVKPCAFDMLSSIYYVRTLDFSTLSMNKRQEVKVLIDDAYYDIYVMPLAKEIVETREGKRYRCIKFAAKMVQGTIFKGDEDILVWVTDDGNKIPVYIEAKIIVGTIKVYLKDTKGLKNPFSSLVK